MIVEIVSQHEELRATMDRCEELADDLDLGRGSPGQLIHRSRDCVQRSTTESDERQFLR
jgi:hypothetical protein